MSKYRLASATTTTTTAINVAQGDHNAVAAGQSIWLQID